MRTITHPLESSALAGSWAEPNQSPQRISHPKDRIGIPRREQARFRQFAFPLPHTRTRRPWVLALLAVSKPSPTWLYIRPVTGLFNPLSVAGCRAFPLSKLAFCRIDPRESIRFAIMLVYQDMLTGKSPLPPWSPSTDIFLAEVVPSSIRFFVD